MDYQIRREGPPERIWDIMGQILQEAMRDYNLPDLTQITVIIVPSGIEKELYKNTLKRMGKAPLASEARKNEKDNRRICDENGFIYSRMRFKGIPIISSPLLTIEENMYVISLR
jgi:hypothetical protein